ARVMRRSGARGARPHEKAISCVVRPPGLSVATPVRVDPRRSRRREDGPVIRPLSRLVRRGPCARKAVSLVAGLATIAAVSGCFTKQCTEIGCNDGFSITTATADKRWAPGEYALDLSVDGELVSCAYTWTNTPQVGGGGVSVQCSPTVAVS